ncbi:hypothetical protein DL93DRAFT_2102837 [Clavulina sp. PMI_390]|nr:hypothetical protein DL93DRAFT_2102837 [Clavulina sp. PMI_390]
MRKHLFYIIVITSSFSAFADAEFTGYSSVKCIAGWEWAVNTLQLLHTYKRNARMEHSPWIRFQMGIIIAAQPMIRPRKTLVFVQHPSTCSIQPAVPARTVDIYQGQYNPIIPLGTRVPAYAFLNPSRYEDYFNPAAARQLIGE